MWPCASSVHDSTFGERDLCQKSQWKIDKRVMCVTHYIQCISSYADSSFHTDLKANRFDSIETQVDHSQTTVRWELTKPSCNYRMYHPAIKKINDVTYFVSNSEGNYFEKKNLPPHLELVPFWRGGGTVAWWNPDPCHSAKQPAGSSHDLGFLVQPY